MTDIQKNIAVANLVIDELHKDKPFDLELSNDETVMLFEIANESHYLHSNFVDWLKKVTLEAITRNSGAVIRVHDHFVDILYHMLSSYIAKHSLPESVVESLGEVS